VDDAERYRTESRKGWGSVAKAWAKHTPGQMGDEMPMVTRMLDLADLQPGAEILELAAGQGELGFLALELAQPGGRLITSDFAPEMLTAAQERAEALGVTGVRFKQIDAESIDVAAASLDVVLCRWGFMLMADPGAALRETRRVLRPGGRLVLAAWTGREDNPWSSVIGDVLVERGLAEPPPPDRPGQFAWGAPGVIGAHLEEAGYVDGITVEAVDFTFNDTFEAWWARTLEMSQSAAVIRGLPSAERDDLEAEFRRRLAPYAAGDGALALPARTWVAGASA